MCGLCGYISNRKADNELSLGEKDARRRIFRGLHLAMECRGTDSAGIATLNKGKLQLTKKAEAISVFRADKTYRKFLENDPEIVIGHTRAAVVGAITDKNAHPFRRGNIVAAHNGMISNYRELDNKVDVDSEVVVNLLHEYKNDFVKAFKEVSGSCALTWFDLSKPDRIYLVSHTNPLAVCTVKALKTVFWASTKDALRLVLEAGIGTEGLDIWSPHPDTVYEITDKLQITKYKVQFKESVYAGQVYGGQGYTWHGGDEEPAAPLALARGEKSARSLVRGDDEEDDEAAGEILDQFGNVVDSEVKSFGTHWSHTDAEAILWWADNDPVCQVCMEDVNMEQKGFWWAVKDFVPLCTRCAMHNPIELKNRYVTHQEFEKMVKDTFPEEEVEKKPKKKNKQLALTKVNSPGSSCTPNRKGDRMYPLHD